VTLKRLALRALTTPFASQILAVFTRDAPTILTLHRMADPDRGISGDDPAILRHNLDCLCKQRFRFLSLEDMISALVEGDRLPPRSVVVTIDDGYADQGDIACPILADFDCYPTIFVTTGFLDGNLWFWWDQIAYILRAAKQRLLTLDALDGRLELDVSDDLKRAASQANVEALCKRVPDEARHNLIARLAEAASVELPCAAPQECAPMAWDDVRRLESTGVRFGPHTVTHPILANTSDEQAYREVDESWRRLCDEARQPLDVFCYPNGQPGDFTDREFENFRRRGLRAAVTGVGGHVTRDSFAAPDACYQIPRFAFPEDTSTLIQYVNGMELAKNRLRRSH
jgi:peptidoglycan/xylan/chitin deacetylase (PgdA/CDA1 family)